MELDELLELLQGSPEEIINGIIAAKPEGFDINALKQYDPSQHSVNSQQVREDKTIYVPNQSGIKDAHGNVQTTAKIVKVARLPIPLQRIIVRRTAAFLVGGEVKLQAQIQKENAVQQNLYETVYKVWRENKLQFKNKRLAKYMMSETECAELWFKDTRKVKGQEVDVLRMNILAPSLGHKLYPVFDSTGNLIAFGYGIDTETRNFFFLYTDEYRYDFVQEKAQNWELDSEPVELGYGKIPIIYYSQAKPQWADVQPLIERLENNLSNHADTNDYNSSPILLLKGKVEGMVAKGERGKAFQMDKEADVKYATWDNSIDSTKNENENLRSWIFSGCGVADLSADFLKSLGDISGAALDRLLIDMHLMAKDMQDDVYGECIQRRINFLKAAVISMDQTLEAAEDLIIEAEYSLFRINDEKENIENALLANGNKPVLDQEASIAYAGLTTDPEATLQKIKDQQDALGETFITQ